MDSFDSNGLEESLAVEKTRERISQMNTKLDSKIEDNQENGNNLKSGNFFSFLGDIMEIIDSLMFLIKILSIPIFIYLLRNEIYHVIKLGSSFLF